jgi:sulfatase maturation enzyme AslB (radical SAM superfamily)
VRAGIFGLSATNLALLSDDVLEFCGDHNILISTSLDGPADLHNKNRPRPGGDSYQRTIAGIRRAREKLGHDRVGALMTTTAASLSRAKDIVDEYVTQGFDGIFLRPLSPYGFAIKTKTYQGYRSDTWNRFYFDGLAYILDLNRQGVPFTEYYAQTIVTKMLAPFSTRYVDLQARRHRHQCHRLQLRWRCVPQMRADVGDGHKNFRLGNVHQDSYEQIMLSDQLLEPLEQSFLGSVPMCSECAFEPYCGADPVFHFGTQGDYVGRKPESEFCNRNMAIFRHLIQLMRTDESARDIFRRWVFR